jgi:hypothetical protein
MQSQVIFSALSEKKLISTRKIPSQEEYFLYFRRERLKKSLAITFENEHIAFFITVIKIACNKHFGPHGWTLNLNKMPTSTFKIPSHPPVFN